MDELSKALADWFRAAYWYQQSTFAKSCIEDEKRTRENLVVVIATIVAEAVQNATGAKKL
jgi:hypothetical protein